MVLKYGECLNCTKRHVGCHSECETYKLFRERLEKIKDAKKQSQMVPTHKKSKDRNSNKLKRGRGIYGRY